LSHPAAISLSFGPSVNPSTRRADVARRETASFVLPSLDSRIQPHQGFIAEIQVRLMFGSIGDKHIEAMPSSLLSSSGKNMVCESSKIVK